METLDIFKAEFTQVNNRFQSKLLGIRWEIPWFNSVFSKLDHLDIFYSCYNVVMTAVMNHTACLPHASCFRRSTGKLFGTVLGINLMSNNVKQNFILALTESFQFSIYCNQSHSSKTLLIDQRLTVLSGTHEIYSLEKLNFILQDCSWT